MRQKAEQERRDKAFRSLVELVKNGGVKINKTPFGVKIEGWSEREDWMDACAVHALMHEGFEVRQKLMAAGITEHTHTH